MCRDNILLHKPQEGRLLAKLTDFGMAMGKDADVHAAGCTLAYAAPEILAEEQPTAKADVYSFGMTVWHLCSGQVLWPSHLKSAYDLVYLAHMNADTHTKGPTDVTYTHTHAPAHHDAQCKHISGNLVSQAKIGNGKEIENRRKQQPMQQCGSMLQCTRLTMRQQHCNSADCFTACGCYC